jgi:hypothetical protein
MTVGPPTVEAAGVAARPKNYGRLYAKFIFYKLVLHQ